MASARSRGVITVVASRKRAYSPHAMAPVRFFSGPRNLERTGRRAGQFSRTLWGAFRSTLLLRAANRQQSKREASRRDIVKIARHFSAGMWLEKNQSRMGRLRVSSDGGFSRPFGTRAAPRVPGTKVPGYSHTVPLGQDTQHRCLNGRRINAIRWFSLRPRCTTGYHRAVPPGQKQGWRVSIFIHFTQKCVPVWVKWHFTLLRNVMAPPRGLPDCRCNVTAAVLSLPD